MKIYVCSTCADDGRLEAVLREGLPELQVTAVECMSGCTRAQTVAFREAGKVAYLFGDITKADIGALKTFAQLYAVSKDGTFPDARVLGTLRTKAIARIPG